MQLFVDVFRSTLFYSMSHIPLRSTLFHCRVPLTPSTHLTITSVSYIPTVRSAKTFADVLLACPFVTGVEQSIRSNSYWRDTPFKHFEISPTLSARIISRPASACSWKIINVSHVDIPSSGLQSAFKKVKPPHGKSHLGILGNVVQETVRGATQSRLFPILD